MDSKCQIGVPASKYFPVYLVRASTASFFFLVFVIVIVIVIGCFLRRLRGVNKQKYKSKVDVVFDID